MDNNWVHERIEAYAWQYWAHERIEAYIWQCGDDCFCCQARIDIIKPNKLAGYPFVVRENIWSGTYTYEGSGIDSDLPSMELHNECEIRNIKLVDDFYCGEWAAK